jgi:hypothetical protein
MQVKTFKAATISLALDQVKKELGPNAIILGNKKVTISPDEFYIEVMAAVEPDAPVPPQTGGQPKLRDAKRHSGNQKLPVASHFLEGLLRPTPDATTHGGGLPQLAAPRVG